MTAPSDHDENRFGTLSGFISEHHKDILTIALVFLVLLPVIFVLILVYGYGLLGGNDGVSTLSSKHDIALERVLTVKKAILRHVDLKNFSTKIRQNGQILAIIGHTKVIVNFFNRKR